MAFHAAVAQFAPRKAEIAQNLDAIVDIVVQAQDEGADLVLLPETATSGYFLEGGVMESSLTAGALVAEVGGRLRGKIRRPIDVVLGFYENDQGGLYNSAAYIEFGPEAARLVHVYKKFFLPTYGVFDEERFVSRGRELGVFDSRLGRMALLICEDVWHSALPTLCAVNGAQVFLVPAASPARGFGDAGIENHDRYRRLLRSVSEEHGVFCLNSQLCGFEGGKGFVGGSMMTDPFGRTLVEAPIGVEHMATGEIDLDLVTIARAQSPLISDLQSAWQDVKRLVERSSF